MRIKKRYTNRNRWNGTRASPWMHLAPDTKKGEEMRKKSRYRLLLCLLAVSLAANPVYAEDIAGTLKHPSDAPAEAFNKK